jgi:hypothetical protein
MAGPEKLVKEHVKQKLKHKGPDVFFFMPAMGQFGFAGVPDFVGSYRGKFFALETKGLGKNPTKLQEICHDLIRAAGGECIVIRGPYDPLENGWAQFNAFFHGGLHQ